MFHLGTSGASYVAALYRAPFQAGKPDPPGQLYESVNGGPLKLNAAVGATLGATYNAKLDVVPSGGAVAASLVGKGAQRKMLSFVRSKQGAWTKLPDVPVPATDGYMFFPGQGIAALDSGSAIVAVHASQGSAGAGLKRLQ